MVKIFSCNRLIFDFFKFVGILNLVNSIYFSIDDEEPLENEGDLLNIPEEYDEIYAEEFNLSVQFNLRENFSVYRRKASLNRYFKIVSHRSQNQFLNGYHFALKDMTIHKRFHRKPFKHLAMQDLVEW